MELDELVLSVGDAFNWAQAHGFPGVPAVGGSLRFESPARLFYNTLFNCERKLVLVRSSCVSLKDGGYYKDRSGNVVQVFESYPGTPYPFEGLHCASRYMADGRHMRHATSRADMASDLVDVTTPRQMAHYREKHAHLPTRDEYAKSADQVRAMFDLGGVMESRSLENRLMALDCLAEITGHAAVRRYYWACKEAARISEAPPSVEIIRSVEDFRSDVWWNVWGNGVATVPLIVAIIVALWLFELALVGVGVPAQDASSIMGFLIPVLGFVALSAGYLCFVGPWISARRSSLIGQYDYKGWA